MLLALRAVIKCIEEYKLQKEYSLGPLQKRVSELNPKDADYRVFLMSLKAGGVALNLTVASHVSLANLISLPTFAQQKFLKLAVNSTGGRRQFIFLIVGPYLAGL